MSKLYEFAAILHPSEEQAKEGMKSKLIVDIQRQLASDESAATLLAARAIPEEYVNDLDRIQVVVRPF